MQMLMQCKNDVFIRRSYFNNHVIKKQQQRAIHNNFCPLPIQLLALSGRCSLPPLPFYIKTTAIHKDKKKIWNHSYFEALIYKTLSFDSGPGNFFKILFALSNEQHTLSDSLNINCK